MKSRSIQVTEYRKLHLSIVLHEGNSTLLERKPSNAEFNQELLFNIQKQIGIDANMPRERVIIGLIVSTVLGLLSLGFGAYIFLPRLINPRPVPDTVMYIIALLNVLLSAACMGLLLLKRPLNWLRSGRPMDGGLYQGLMEDGVVLEGELINVRSVEIATPRGKQSATEIAYKYPLPNGEIKHDSYMVFSNYHPESNRVKLWYIAIPEPDKA